jgi:6-phosphogluconolactonase
LKTERSDFFVKSDEPSADELPLKSTTVVGCISGLIADDHTALQKRSRTRDRGEVCFSHGGFAWRRRPPGKKEKPALIRPSWSRVVTEPVAPSTEEIMMSNPKRNTFKLLGLALALGAASLPALASGDDDDDGFRAGKVFTSTNAVAGNELLVYDTGKNGHLTLQTRIATQGAGTGTGLGNQGGVTLSGDGRYLFVINAASNTVSTFAINRHRLTLQSTVDSGGLRPISVTEHEGVVYVLNANGAGNLAGFRHVQGVLRPIAGSSRPLSAVGGTGPAQVGFSPDGDVLLVTEKSANKLTTYRVRSDGTTDAPVVTASSGVTPFGFAFDRRGHALVSEAASGALSSYGFGNQTPAHPVLISASVSTTQAAPCWVVVTPNSRYAYVANAGSSSVSSFAVQKSGQLTLAQGVAGAAGAGPVDLAISSSGRQLFVLNAGSQTISSFSVGQDGRLTNPGSGAGLPVGANGLAAN